MTNKIIIIAIVVLIGGGLACYLLVQKPVIQEEVLIVVENPQLNEIIQSPYAISGRARGYWFFEASFPVKLLDENGQIIGQTIAQAQGDWMTEDFVPFESILTFSVSKDQNGTLVFEKDNPSGLPENDAQIRTPVFLKSSKTISLYYYNQNLDKDSSGNILCSRQGLVPVERQIPITITPIQDAIKLLVSGDLTGAEKAQGIGTEYPLSGFSQEAASLNNGILTLTFNDPDNKTSGGSCRAGILWYQIEATAKQFEGVSQVRFLPENLFQP